MPKVQMPQLGESVAEGTIGKWLKKPGDHVAKYEPIVEVITDKVNAEVPSPYEGTLTEILVQEGDTVPNNTEIAVIETAGAAEPTAEAEPQPEPPAQPAAQPAAAAQTAVAAEPAAGPYGAGNGPGGSDERPSPERMPAPPAAVATAEKTAVAASGNGNGASAVDTYEGRMTPAVRRLAREYNVDLALIAGTGHSGRVTREDVEKFVEQMKAGTAPTAPAARPAAAPAAAPVAAATASAAPAGTPAAPPMPAAAQEDTLKPASPMRKAIAAQMTRAVQVPVAYTIVEVDMSGVVALRDANKGAYQAREGISLSFDAFVAKATVEALRRHPDFNAHYTDEGHWLRHRVNLGVAVAVEDGLVVPVMHDADRLSIHGLNREIRDLAERARGGRLKLDDIQGGTFTLDNTGWTGSIITAPIINTPEVGILTLESIRKRAVVIESAAGDAIAIRPQMFMCLGFDHRATDGAQAGKFVAEVKRWLEAVDSSTAIW
jgi:pyruvate/2-oxoglutarate dehydrogenase complex dihydrolipoamide acyltransferase (E2) component